ncbi:long-chain-fatty-acyl-CoA reductase [Candidatus Heimdallarchaeota archaeon B3_Heim]|nr:MAG: long-chain-fatty-acyl-CoA reductase [Candidatus Heimdallarchaeota archaeon B3_Heim]
MQSTLVKTMDTEVFEIPILLRGKLIKDYSETFGGRNGAKFLTPSAKKYANQISLSDPSKMKDLYDLSIEEIITFLHDLGQRLILKENEYLQAAYELACQASGLTPEVLHTTYQTLPMLFHPSNIREMLDKRIGIEYLESWVPTKMEDGRTIAIRAFGSRTVHIIAGNVPTVSAASLIRSCGTRCDAIFKLPSNDPLTATALIQTMMEMEPQHPITKHCSVLYWRGGDTHFEEKFYRPENIEKIIAWGGFNSIKYISRYLQPGIDLITFDPKISTSIIGRDAFQDDQTLYTVAQRAAIDVGAFNQEACLNSRIMYVQSGTTEDGIERLNTFGKILYSALVNLPSHVSTPPKIFNETLKDDIEGIRLDDDFYHIYGGKSNEGAVIVSQFDEPVDFSHRLCSRVVNLVPVDTIDTALQSVNSYTQTVGIFPESLKLQIRDILPLYGVQRVVSLGFAANASMATPQDAIEPLRRMCKWITDEKSVL